MIDSSTGDREVMFEKHTGILQNIANIPRLFSQVYFMIFKGTLANKILQSSIYFVNFKFYQPRKYIKHVNTQTNSNIQSSEIRVERIGLHPD